MTVAYDLAALADLLGLAWTVALGFALRRNNNARWVEHDDGSRTLALVDFGLFLPSGVAVCGLLITAAIWFGLTVN